MAHFKFGGLICCLGLAALSPAAARAAGGGQRQGTAPARCGSGARATLNVPSQYATIQAALDAAADGDQIVVADGLYGAAGDINLDFQGKAVTLRSASGDPSACTIYCGYGGRGFWFHSGETAAAVVDGFLIQSGQCFPETLEVRGGGILCTNGSSPTISNCVLQYCQSTGRETETPEGSLLVPGGGGGLACLEQSHPALVNCVIEQCTATPAFGGGVLCDGGSSPSLTGCTIRNCEGQRGRAYLVGGGGLACLNGSNAILTDCLIDQNSAPNDAGGLACCSSNPILRRCTFTANDGYFAGGVYCEHSSPTLHDCIIAENAGWCASGVFCEWYSYPEITACRITAGRAADSSHFLPPPGIVCRAASSLTLASCLVDDDGSLWAQSYGHPVVRNCTFTGSVVTSYSSDILLQSSIIWPAEMRVRTLADFPARLSVSYCDVQGGEAAVQVEPGGALLWGAGNIDADPGFVSPDGPDGDPATWQDNDYHLSAGSACIDAGLPGFAPQAGETDIDGQYRVWQVGVGASGRVDMGADEFGAPSFGDLNCDGAINAFDIDPFVLALAAPDDYAGQYPACTRALADLNGDGAVNAFDIDPFVSRLTGGEDDQGRN